MHITACNQALLNSEFDTFIALQNKNLIGDELKNRINVNDRRSESAEIPVGLHVLFYWIFTKSASRPCGSKMIKNFL